MTRPLRVEYSGAWYHVMNRGLAHQTIFHDTEYFNIFLNLLSDSHEKYQIQIHAYCLMTNHYHLLVHTPLPNLGRALQYIDGLYTVRHNRLFGRDGPLFRGRYKAILVDADSYLLQLSRYIHLNPISAEILKEPADYFWSSYKYYMNQENKPAWLFLDKILNYFHNHSNEDYRKYILQDHDDEINTFYCKKRFHPILGSENFVEKIIKYVKKNNFDIKEMPECCALMKNNLPSIDEIIEVTSEYFSVKPLSLLQTNRGALNLPRKIAIYLCYQLTGKSQQDIAKIFGGLGYSAISKIYKRINHEIKQKHDIINNINLIKSRLSNVKI